MAGGGVRHTNDHALNRVTQCTPFTGYGDSQHKTIISSITTTTLTTHPWDRGVVSPV
jgi:hypothetical protein